MDTTKIRPAAVAGFFYPSEPEALRGAVTAFLDEVAASGENPVPKALVAPHAGYVYSGPVAATAYALLRPARERITRVVLLGPAHRVYLEGLALPVAEAFQTPLGLVPLDTRAESQLAGLHVVARSEDAHRLEHSLEVQLPFLQTVLAHFSLVPLVVGQASAKEVADVLERLWGGEETLIVVSSDLSHYHDYDTAQAMDRATSTAIEQGRLGPIDPDHACGCRALAGLLLAARRHGLTARTVDLRNSGDTAGPRDRVVGYGAFALQ